MELRFKRQQVCSRCVSVELGLQILSGRKVFWKPKVTTKDGTLVIHHRFDPHVSFSGSDMSARHFTDNRRTAIL